LSPDDDVPNVVPLGNEPIPEAPAPVTRPSRLHGLSIASMAVCALIGISATFLFVTVTWPGETGRYVGAVIFLATVGFIASAATAVFTAARDTYAIGRRKPTEQEGDGD
jgi:hypothetical protein